MWRKLYQSKFSLCRRRRKSGKSGDQNSYFWKNVVVGVSPQLWLNQLTFTQHAHTFHKREKRGPIDLSSAICITTSTIIWYYYALKKNVRLITCEDRIFIPSLLQCYILHWYLTYLLHLGMYRTEVIICQLFYWTCKRNSTRKEVNNHDTCWCTKQFNNKYGKLLHNEAA